VPLFAILTLFPEALDPYLRAGILGLAQERGLIRVLLVDFRDFSRDRHRTVDDRPFGGGPGMVLRPEPIVECVEWLEARHGRFRKFLLCPTGPVFRQELADELKGEERVLLLCGRYEGVDARVAELLELEPLSIGDYVLCGGELPALVVTEAVARLLPGALGDERSAVEESFRGEPGAPPLDHPHYTRPRSYRGREVPEVLLSGDHAAIARWRAEQARKRTERWRPDLLEGRGPTPAAHDNERTERTTTAREARSPARPASPRQPDTRGAPEERPQDR
jgi:tRNA (guanine37-N1)-methyltransferase